MHLAHQTNYSLSIPSTWTPSDVLFRLINELKSPARSVDGYTKLLSERDIDSAKTLAAIESNVKYIHTMFDAVLVYLMDTGYLAKEYDVMQFLREKVWSR